MNAGIAGTPLYMGVYETLRERIQSGSYEVGAALPSEPRLREEFKVSTITIRRAVHELSLDGLVEPRQGVGNIVRDASGSEVVVGMSSFTSDVANGRLRLIRTLLVDDVVSATSDIARKLGVQPGSMLRHLVRVDSEGGAPLSTDEAFVPPAFASGITSDVAASPVFMHLWQEASGMELTHTQYEIWTEPASTDDCELLSIDVNAPVLVTGELILRSDDKPVAWIVSRYRGDRGRLSAKVTLVQRKTSNGIVGE